MLMHGEAGHLIALCVVWDKEIWPEVFHGKEGMVLAGFQIRKLLRIGKHIVFCLDEFTSRFYLALNTPMCFDNPASVFPPPQCTF